MTRESFPKESRSDAVLPHEPTRIFGRIREAAASHAFQAGSFRESQRQTQATASCEADRPGPIGGPHGAG